MEATRARGVMIHKRTLTCASRTPYAWPLAAVCTVTETGRSTSKHAGLGDVGLASTGHVRYGHLEDRPPKRHAADHHSQPLSFLASSVSGVNVAGLAYGGHEFPERLVLRARRSRSFEPALEVEDLRRWRRACRVRLAVLVLVGWHHCLARGEAAKLMSVIAWRMSSRVGGSSMLSAARALPAAGFGLSLEETETWLNNVRAA
jgi:hypothetical protein